MKRIILICIIAVSALSAAGCTEVQSTGSAAVSVEESITLDASEPEPEPEPAWESLDDLLASHEWTAEAETSSRVDEILLAAMADAATVSDDVLIEAQNYIGDAYPNFFIDAGTMEKLMFCGQLLEKACGEVPSRHNNATLGWKTVKSIKYVYRGAEAVEDEATQTNMEAVGECLKQLGLID